MSTVAPSRPAAAEGLLAADALVVPRRPGGDPVVRAIAGHKALVAAIAVIVATLGALAGAARKPTYTAAATLQVGTVNPNSPGFYGFVQSAADLATAFSRSIEAAPVLDRIHAKLGLSATQAVGRLSAEPIPISPSFRVIAKGPSSAAAIELANTAGAAVISYESSVNSTSPRAVELLKSYGAAAQALHKASAAVERLSAQPHASRSAALLRARAERDAAQLHANALGAAYQSALVSSGPSSGLVSLLAGAATASSDHKSKIELLGFVGLLVGLVLGAVAAVLYERIRKPRHAQ